LPWDQSLQRKDAPQDHKTLYTASLHMPRRPLG
jgi:hypothetical protein